MPKKLIPLIRSSLLPGLLLATEDLGVDARKLAFAVGIPESALDSPDAWVSLIQVQQFIEKSAQLAGDNLYGLRAAQASPLDDLETIKPLLSGCDNLYCVLSRFCTTSQDQCNIAPFRLIENGNHVTFAQVGEQRVDVGDRHAEVYEVAAMIQLVQIAAGTNWRPYSIHFMQPMNSHIDRCETFQPCRIYYSQSFPAITFSRSLLTLPVEGLSLVTDLSESGSLSNHLQSASNVTDALRSLLMQHVKDTRLSSDLAQELSGMSFRTLQRKLQEEGSSFSDIAEQVKYIEASRLMKTEDARLIDISLSLGYENASAFTRSFKKWSGMTPREYRNQYKLQGSMQ